ncbi:energy-coupling factor ABC transporter substrate-binding protein [Guggenheimella bovis]
MKKAFLLLLLAVVIAVTPLLFIKDSEFAGADGVAEEVVEEVNPGYEPWAEPIMEPPGGETESLLFALQAALGAFVIGYIMGGFVTRYRMKHHEVEAL